MNPLHATALLACALLAACTPPTQRDPARFGTVRVGFDESLDGVYAWRDDQLAQIEPLFTELDAIGPDFVHVSPGEADVVVRAASLGGACEVFTTNDPNTVQVDAACAMGYLALRRAVAHGLVHWLTWNRWHYVGHVCDWPIGAPVPPTCHPTILCPGDDCLMSRGLVHLDDGPTFGEAYTGDLADPTPAAADLELVAHCATTGCLP